MAFDLEKAVKPLVGLSFPTYQALRAELSKIRLNALSSLPSDYSEREMFNMMRANGLVSEGNNGVLHIIDKEEDGDISNDDIKNGVGMPGHLLIFNCVLGPVRVHRVLKFDCASRSKHRIEVVRENDEVINTFTRRFDGMYDHTAVSVRKQLRFVGWYLAKTDRFRWAPKLVLGQYKPMAMLEELIPRLDDFFQQNHHSKLMQGYMDFLQGFSFIHPVRNQPTTLHVELQRMREAGECSSCGGEGEIAEGPHGFMLCETCRGTGNGPRVYDQGTES